MAQHNRLQAPASEPSVTNGAGLSIRPVEPRDGPGLHQLLTASLPDVIADRDRWLARWRWQCWDSPYRQGRPAGFVLAERAQILGHLGAVYVPLHVGHSIATGVIGTDYAVSPEAATRAGAFIALDLVQRLVSACPDAVLMATTANEKTGAVFARFGCTPVEWTRGFWRASTGPAQQVRTCCGGPSRLVRRAMSGWGGGIVGRALVLGYRTIGRQPRIPIARGCSLDTTVPQLAHELGPLWEAVRADRSGAVGADRSSSASAGIAVHACPEYLDWRYARHPERDRIRVLVLRGPGGRALAAAILFRDERPDRHVAYLEDLICRSSDRASLQTMLCAALRLAAAAGAEYLITAPGNPAIGSVYWELGFEQRARNAPALLIGIPRSMSGVSAESSRLAAGQLQFWHGLMF